MAKFQVRNSSRIFQLMSFPQNLDLFLCLSQMSHFFFLSSLSLLYRISCLFLFFFSISSWDLSSFDYHFFLLQEEWNEDKKGRSRERDSFLLSSTKSIFAQKIQWVYSWVNVVGICFVFFFGDCLFFVEWWMLNPTAVMVLLEWCRFRWWWLHESNSKSNHLRFEKKKYENID